MIITAAGPGYASHRVRDRIHPCGTNSPSLLVIAASPNQPRRETHTTTGQLTSDCPAGPQDWTNSNGVTRTEPVFSPCLVGEFGLGLATRVQSRDIRGTALGAQGTTAVVLPGGERLPAVNRDRRKSLTFRARPGASSATDQGCGPCGEVQPGPDPPTATAADAGRSRPARQSPPWRTRCRPGPSPVADIAQRSPAAAPAASMSRTFRDPASVTCCPP